MQGNPARPVLGGADRGNSVRLLDYNARDVMGQNIHTIVTSLLPLSAICAHFDKRVWPLIDTRVRPANMTSDDA